VASFSSALNQGIEQREREIMQITIENQRDILLSAITAALNLFDGKYDPSMRHGITDELRKAQQAVLEGDAYASEIVDKAAKYDAINTPEINDFIEAVRNEALHQRERWGSEHDAGKTDADWLWLVGFLAGKAIRPDNTPEKQLHHIITTAAALLNWHAAKIGAHNAMRPGIGPDAQPPKPSIELAA
jgi:hypothetical protein